MNDDALKKLWQEQPLDPGQAIPTMEQLTAMKQKMTRFDRVINRRDLGELIAALFGGGYFSFVFFQIHSLTARVGCVVIVLGMVLIMWRLLWNSRRQVKMEPNASVMDALKIELQKVEIQIGLLKSVFWWYILPIMVGVNIFFIGMNHSNAERAGYFVFTVLLGVFIYWLNQRAVRKQLLPLKTELESLLDPEKATVAPPPSPQTSAQLRKLLWFAIGCLCGGTLTLLWGLAAMQGKIWLMTVTILIVMALITLLVAMIKSARTRSFGAGVWCGIALLFAWAHHLNAAAGSTGKAMLGTDIQQYLKDCVDKEKRTPGIVVGILDEKGSRVFAYGKTTAGSTNEVNGDTLFEIGSITKVFTSLTLAEMVERGEVKLDDPISKFLPAAVKAPTRNGKQIALVDLATHTSGLPRLPGNLSGWAILRHMDNPYADYSVQQLYDFLSGYTLPRDIGTKYEYSNLGGGLLGHVLALRAGTNYETLVEQRICHPLGLTNTVITLTSDQQKRLAHGHDENGNAVSNWDMPTLAGAGALKSSVNDLMIFLAANMGRVKTGLQPAIELTQKPRHDAGSSVMQIGLAWHILKFNETEIIWHNGGTGGYRSYLGFNPKTHRGVVVLSNSAKEVDHIGRTLLDSNQ